MKVQYYNLPEGRLFKIYGDERIWRKCFANKAYCEATEVYLIVEYNQVVFTVPSKIKCHQLMKKESFMFVPNGNLYTMYDKHRYSDRLVYVIGDNNGTFLHVDLPNIVYAV